jgi:hypothetical protein
LTIAEPAGTAAGASPEAFVASTRRAVLFCRDDRGLPIGYPMSIFLTEGTTLLFTTYAKSAKVARFEADPYVHVVVQSGGADEPTWLSFDGSLRVERPDGAQVDAMFERRTQDPRVPAAVTASVRARLVDGRRVLLRVVPSEPSGLEVRAGRLPGGPA